MTVFKVHYTDANGNKLSTFASADTPEAAADGVKHNVPGAIVTKVKVDRSGKVSPRELEKVKVAVDADKMAERFKAKAEMSSTYGKVGTKQRSDCITVDGKLTDIERGSMRHAEIDSTHRMRSDGSYFKSGGN